MIKGHRMQLRIVVLSILLCLVCAQLQILSPDNLKKYWKKESPKAAIANFGYVPWGRKLSGEVYLAKPYKACETLEPFTIPKDKAEEADKYPIILAERGGCTFTQKAQNAQLAGARMLIVVDTLEEPLDQTMPVGDGQDSSVHIPTVMIGPRHGAKMKEFIENGERVTVTMNFELPKSKEDKVKLELWLSGTDTRSFELAKGLRDYIQKIGFDQVITKPYYAIWYCPYCKEINYTTTDNENCFSGGRYCSPDPDDSGPLTGRDILREDLRQLCLADLSIEAWFQYMSQYDPKCPYQDGAKMDDCFKKGMKNLKFTPKEIDECVNLSFEGPNELLDDNWRLRKQRTFFKRRGIQIWPSIVLNGFLYRGNVLPVTNVYEAICEDFSTMPSSCVEHFQRKKAESIYEEPEEFDLFSVVAWITVLATIFLVIALCFYRRWIRRELMRDLNNQLNARISEYMAMQDEEKVGNKETKASA